MEKVLQIHTRYREPGGEDVVADRERALLEEHGHEVVAVRRENSPSGLGAVRQLATYAWDPLSDRRLLALARRTKPTVAHFHNTWYATSPSILRALKREGIRTVVTIHNYRLSCVNSYLLRDGSPCELCVGRSPWPGVRHKCYRDGFATSAAAALGIEVHRRLGTWRQLVDQFLALTDFSTQLLVKAGLPAGRISLHPNFVDDPGPRTSSPSASRIVTYVGRLSPEKGLAEALAVWREVSPEGLELVIAGDGPQRADLEAAGVDSVRFLGRLSREEVNDLLLESRAVILPSRWYEGQPLGALEAFAAGVPVLGSALGGLRETIEPLGADWAVETTGRAWEEALRRLADDRFVERGGEAARRTFEERHSAKMAITSLQRAYQPRDDLP